MSRFKTCFVLLMLTLGTISLAQQTQSVNEGAGPLTIINCVLAATGRVPVFTATAPPNITICNSGIYEGTPYGTGPIGILNPNPVAALDVNGDINATKTYQVGGSTVLNIGNSSDSNLFLGVGAGANNVAGQGIQNTFAGYQAGYSNMSGHYNAFYGSGAGYNNTTGTSNVFFGLEAGYRNTTGFQNVFSGFGAGVNNSTGINNAFYGAGAGGANTAGNGNIFLGFVAGDNNTTGNNNIYIGNLGPVSGTESSTIRLGGDVGTGYGPQTAAYIAGIFGATSSGGVAVYINSNGQLGTLTSSVRFKEQIHDMGDSTDALMRLRPVTFLYKPDYDEGKHMLQYGLIAEEVAGVYPELVAYDNDGQPYSVRYQYLTSMLLNELQKQYHHAQSQAEVIKAQERKIDALEQRLSRVERLVDGQVQMVASK